MITGYDNQLHRPAAHCRAPCVVLFCSPTFRVQAAAAARIKDDNGRIIGVWSPAMNGDYSLLCDYITADPSCVNRSDDVIM